MSTHSTLIVGCGSIGERHLRCFHATGRTEVTACDADPALLAKLAEVYQVRTVENFEAALASGRFDSVVIATPAHLHVRQALLALERGCHVLIEKPLSQSLAGTDELLAARERSDCRAAVAYVHQIFPFLREAREFVQRGEIGPVRLATYVGGQPFHRMRPAHAVHYARTYFRDHRTGGGTIQDALTHVANWMESVLGPTDSVLCDASHQALAGVTVEDTVNLSARHGDVLVNYAINQFQAPNEATIQLNTATASVKIEYHRQRWGVWRESDSDWNWREAAVSERDAHFIAQAHAFIDLIEGKAAACCSLEAALQTLRFNLAALASTESGTRTSCAHLPV